LSKHLVETIYITRKCSFRCPHCIIWRTHRTEIPPKEWIKIINSHYGTIADFVVILGGEPLEYWKPIYGLLEVVKGIKEVDYGIHSNSLLINEKTAKMLVDAHLKNWSFSIDFPESYPDIRNKACWRALRLFKKLGVPDLHVTLTLYPQNVKYFPQVVKELMEMEVWIGPSFVMWAKSKHYDSFPKSCKPKWSAEHLKYIREGIKLLKKYKYFHGVEDLFTKDLDSQLNATFKCGKLLIPTIEEDGYMRLCRDILGKRVRKWHALEILNHYDEYVLDWLYDYKTLCKGCNWDCAYHAKISYNNFKHVEVR